jgi:hypothetical protein
VTLRSTFRSNVAPQVNQAVDDILLNPPFREVVSGGSLGWDTSGPDDSLSEIEKLLIYIRRVRNNLFHAGKFASEVKYDREWDTSLLRASVVILHECLKLSPLVKAEYDLATL